jgi:biopolymer transport protein ExbD
MKRSGFIVRFIDVGLIVLFGFLYLSDISVEANIQLPGEQENAPTPPEDRTTIEVEILGDGTFVVRDFDRSTGFDNIVTIPQLGEAITTLRQENEDLGRSVSVAILPRGASPMQRTIDVMDLCDRLGVSKSLNTSAALESEAAEG